jgi:formamidopyrimidine-DNA glycosylase
MPELPDLEYIVKKLRDSLTGLAIEKVAVREPIVLRMLTGGRFVDVLGGQSFLTFARHGPFLRIELSDLEIIIHFMLSGKLRRVAEGQHMPQGRDVCFAFRLSDRSTLVYEDSKRMGRVYVTERGETWRIPGFSTQGIDILDDEFSETLFMKLMGKSRKQARVFLMDQSTLSAIGNAYADEILFDAGIHPKTRCSALSEDQRKGLYKSIRSVIRWAIEEVERAGQPLDVKVRDHLKVRNRKGEPCPRCGTTIRRTSVLGVDSFYCPNCQPGKQAIPWS